MDNSATIRTKALAEPVAHELNLPPLPPRRPTVNPKNNLAHCFCCGQNLNNIDLLIQLGYNFRSAARLLEQWLLLYQTQQAKTTNPTPPPARK